MVTLCVKNDQPRYKSSIIKHFSTSCFDCVCREPTTLTKPTKQQLSKAVMKLVFLSISAVFSICCLQSWETLQQYAIQRYGCLCCMPHLETVATDVRIGYLHACADATERRRKRPSSALPYDFIAVDMILCTAPANMTARVLARRTYFRQ